MTAVVTPILHVDMDAFYASVATRDRPELRDQPVIVGGGHRGVVLSASYQARAFGVRSGMPGAQARRLCPQAVTLAPDFDAFSTVSRAVMETFRRVTPLVEVASLDEAFLDVGGAVRRLGPPEAIAEQLRARIHDEQGITCSVGLAATRSVAKLASRRAKPDGVLTIAPDQVVEQLHPLDVGELYGVGESTRSALRALGLHTVGDVARMPLEVLQHHLGRASGAHLMDLALGTDRSEVVARNAAGFGLGEPDRSMGAQETFGRDSADRGFVLRQLLRLAARVCRRMRGAGKVGRTVAITVRYADFRTLNRSRTLPEPTDVTQEVYRTAVALYDALGAHRDRLRLVGVRVEGLVSRAGVHHQLELGEPDHGWADADRAVDRAVARFGSAVVGPASLLRHDRGTRRSVAG
ncbi:DNA polymerase IV [Nocardioides lianchengensis]|uniref:DNA polymerase IV n=1 Tax=Nocardioides lianchengensis TaxID=1045774 RepID=A0A1G6QUC9_9ACTN|nr:DNA polymerase IV [Nocardioides lianchengensis]NYG10508.1 DNA polymerase-4 [Nocardioides lianchengensis]SDC95306.1 DNA polymerase-4 [Nocardioides lianchengensis]